MEIDEVNCFFIFCLLYQLGCGKTMLMDMLYKNINIGTKKKRVHFNQFMIDVHKRIHQFKLDAPPVNHRDKTSKPLDPIPPIARDISDETWFLCFDEFQVSRINIFFTFFIVLLHYIVLNIIYKEYD